MLEVTDAVLSVWDAGLVGMHLAPRMDGHDVGDSDRLGTFSYVARALGERGIAFICAREHKADDWIGPQLKKIFGGVYIANEGFSQESAQAALDAGEADAVAFGKLYIANPDLAERFAAGAPLNEPNSKTFYTEGAPGYTDYPALRAEAA
jgi:2,4-dienoyl-CoA reductase-like NADH-dependent reductase (Old Yellow Enzyme family)